MKLLKPGQLCTICGVRWNPQKKTVEKNAKNVYRCKKAMTSYMCTECIKANNKHMDCILSYNGVRHPVRTCLSAFGPQNYPVLVK